MIYFHDFWDSSHHLFAGAVPVIFRGNPRHFP